MRAPARAGTVALGVLGVAAVALGPGWAAQDEPEDPATIPQSAPHRDDFAGTVADLPGAARFAWRCTEDHRFALAVFRPEEYGPAVVTGYGNGRRVVRTTVQPGASTEAPPAHYRSFRWVVREDGPIGSDRTDLRLRLAVRHPPGVCLMQRMRIRRTFRDNFNE